MLGNDDFDVEVWNEMSFGSNFLDISKYYDPVPALLQGTGSVTDQLLARTVQWIREPANDLPDVGIGDGFANESPFVSGANLPLGLTAIDKHPYPPGFKQFPQDALQSVYVQNGIRPVNALGQPDGVDVFGTWADSFRPTYDAFFPEYYLSGIQTEYMERILSPITTTLNGTPYGRNVMPPGATTRLQDWITEMNIDPADGGLTNIADKEHLQAKAALRTLSAYVNKGVSALYFYAVSNGDWTMVDPTQPGGGPTMTAIQRFTQAFAGPDTITTPLPQSPAGRRSGQLDAVRRRWERGAPAALQPGCRGLLPLPGRRPPLRHPRLRDDAQHGHALQPVGPGLRRDPLRPAA